MTTDTPPAEKPQIDPDVAATGLKLLRIDAGYDDWDLPPRLAMITRDDDGPDVHPIIVPDWSIGPAPLVVAGIASLVKEDKMRFGTIGGARRHDQIIGAMFCFESWGIHGDGMTRQEMDEIHEWGKTHSFADQPAGHESRCMAMIDTRGVFAFAEHVRGKQPPQTCVTGMTGRVVRSVTMFMEAVQGNPNVMVPIPKPDRTP